jgi:hypothetical protein
VKEDSNKTLSKVGQIDEQNIQKHLGGLVCGTVEDRLNGMLEAEALCRARGYERST